jgi:hypothetical protein
MAPFEKGSGLTLVLSIFRRQAMRSLVIEHAAKITAINPSAAGFAHEEMLGFRLVRISVPDNIFSRGIFIRLSSIYAFSTACLCATD